MVYLFHPDEGAEIESPKFGFTDDRLQTTIQIHFLY
jgi:hypothetical protein